MTNTDNFQPLLEKSITSREEYFSYVKALYEEWKSYRLQARTEKYFQTCEKLGKYIPQLVPLQPPQFFTGDINFDVAIISLNPHAGTNYEIDTVPFCQSWEEYLMFWTNFSQERYAKCGKASNLISKLSRFDVKLQHFLSGNINEVTSQELAKWNVFHVELFPIASAGFSISGIDEYPCLYLVRMLEVLALKDRQLILVLNAQLSRLLRKAHRLGMLTLEDCRKQTFFIGSKSKKVLRENSVVRLKNGKILNITATPTFACQGYLSNRELAEYSEKIFTAAEKSILIRAIGAAEK